MSKILESIECKCFQTRRMVSASYSGTNKQKDERAPMYDIAKLNANVTPCGYHRCQNLNELVKEHDAGSACASAMK